MDILLEEVENIKTLEESVLKLSCLLMEVFIQVLDEKLFREKPSYLEPIGFRTRNLATRLGEINIAFFLSFFVVKLYNKASGGESECGGCLTCLKILTGYGSFP